MSGLRLLGIALIVLGVLGLVYGQFSYTRKIPRCGPRRAEAGDQGAGDGQRSATPHDGAGQRSPGYRTRSNMDA